MMTRWAILTGEYPPQRGGVSDYTRLIARGLADAGDSVSVFAPAASGGTPSEAGVVVRRLPDHFGPRGLLVLDRELGQPPRPDRILIQYVPHAYGCKAMNWPFVAWVAGRARRIAPVWVMFHEVMYPIEKGQKLRHAILGRVNRAMARRLAGAAERVFVSIPSWGGLLREIGHAGPAEWLPVPSNVPGEANRERVEAERGRLGKEAVSIGHFGTFGVRIVDLLAPALAELLRRSPERRGLLIGRNGPAFAARFAGEHPELAGRMTATGELPAEEVSAHLAACDLLLQPYPDGASCRRTSLMSGLALGVATVTTAGVLTEPFWRESGAVALAAVDRPGELLALAESLLADPERRTRLGKEAKSLYEKRFGVGQVVRVLRSDGGD